MDPYTALSLARTAVELARVTGLIRSSADKAAERIGDEVRAIVMAPLHEGLDRIEMAAKVDNETRRSELLSQARAKLHDAAAQPRIPEHARVLACMTASTLASRAGDAAEAREWAERAMRINDGVLTALTKKAVIALEARESARRSPSLFVQIALGPALSHADWGRRQARAFLRERGIASSDELDQMNAEV